MTRPPSPFPSHEALSAATRKRWRQWGAAIAVSLLVHVVGYVVLHATGRPPLDLSLELNSDLEFGLADAPVPVEPISAGPLPSMPASAPVPPLPPEGGSQAPGDPGWGPPEPDAGVPEPDAAPPLPDAEVVPDAAKKKKRPPKIVPDAGPPPPPDAAAPASVGDAARPDAMPAPVPDPPSVAAATDAVSVAAVTDAGTAPPTDATPPPAGLAAQAPSGAIALPAGAQIALRMDLAAIRASPLAEETRALLAAIPDWRMLLDGSGVDPVAALDRVLIASPGLRRDRMVLAGRLSGTEGAVAEGTVPDGAIVRQSVESLARIQGTPATWTTVDGRSVAPWANIDATRRHVALLDARHFAIARLEDLPAVLALAQARVEAREGGPHVEGEPDAGPRVMGAEALLWMAPDTVVSGEVDGARRLLRGHPPLAPERLRVALLSLTGERIVLEAEATYPTAAEARTAVEAVEAQRRHAQGDPMTMVALGVMGLSGTLAGLVVEVREETRLYAAVELSHGQVRALLTYIRTSLEAREAQRKAAQASSQPPALPSAARPTSAPAPTPASKGR